MITSITKAQKEAKKQLADKKLKKSQPKELIEKKPKPQPAKKITYTNDFDVKIGDPIDYFDPELSYELTGYRPITMTEGLDFSLEPFIHTRSVFDSTGNYTTYLPGHKLYNDFWTEQWKRCNQGYTVGRYTITGDNYFFLNFYRLQAAVENPITKETTYDETFPAFFAQQYIWFHYFRMCELVGKDAGALKPRGVGWSQIAASMGLRMYTCVRQSKCIYAASLESQLTPTLSKVWDQMEFLNTQTNGGMKHLRMAKNTDMRRRASKKLKDGTEIGFKSEIEGLIIDNPRKMRGSRVQRLFFEEAGSNDKLKAAYSQGEALITVSGRRIGLRAFWGTGGDSGPQLAGLAEMFYSPEAYNVLPYKNSYNSKGDVVYTAFFIPAYAMLQQFMDARGVCDEQAGMEYYNNIRLKKSQNASALMHFKSEFCFYPEEALIREGENRFDGEKLAEQLANIELHKLVLPPTIGKLHWPLDKETGHANINAIPQFTPTSDGKIRILEYPMMDEHNIAYSNLYVGGIDSIDADQSSSSGQTDVSEFCIVIKRRQLGLKEPKYVAIYKDRPKDIRTAYDNAIKLLQWYNCKAVLESTRVGIVTYFKEKNKLNLLFKRPRATMNDIQAKTSRQYGTIASEKVINHQLELIDIFIMDYAHTIGYVDMLNELIKYSYANKRKFDIVASMGMCELGDEELCGIQPRSSQPTQKEWRDVGYYYDENGYKKFGVIPKK